MARIPCEHPASPRSLVFLCQECGGDLRRLRQYAEIDEEWVCEHCQAVWVYGEAGWERVQR